VREARHHHSEDKIKQRINEEVPYVSSPPQKPKHAVRPSDEALSDEMVTSIYTVLLNSWCWRRSESEPKDIITPPSEPFELAVREIPVVQGENGAYQLLLDKKCEWGVKTSYDGNCIQYPTILISIPPELSHLTDKSVSEAYQNIVIRGLDEPEALPGIPLCNDAVYGKHAILFKFKGSKDREPHLFYLRTAQDQEKLRQEKEMIQRDIEAEQWLETVRLGRAKHDEATKQRKDRERKEREHAAQKQEREKEWERERDRDRGRTTRRRHSVRR
jgi:hypothetical protein